MIPRRIKSATTQYVETIFSPKVEKKWSFSKILVIAVCAVTLAITIFSCVAMWYFNNIDALMYLIPAVFAECATVTGFYSYKAKAENEIKLDTQRKLITALLREQVGQDPETDEESCG